MLDDLRCPGCNEILVIAEEYGVGEHDTKCPYCSEKITIKLKKSIDIEVTRRSNE